MRNMDLGGLIPEVYGILHSAVAFAGQGVTVETFDALIAGVALEGYIMTVLAQIGLHVGRCLKDGACESAPIHSFGWYDLTDMGRERLSRALRRQDFQPAKSELGECARVILEFCERAGFDPQISTGNANNMWEIRLSLGQFRRAGQTPSPLPD